VVRAHLHALGAADAPLEKLALFYRAGRTNHLFAVGLVRPIGDAHGRNRDGASRDRSEHGATLEVGLLHGALAVGQEAELDHVFGAGALAVEAHVALVLAVLHAALRAIGALAADEAQIAVGAL